MARKLAKKQPEVLRYEELEQRVLFSADLMPGLDADTDAVYEPALVQDVAEEVQTETTAASDPAVQVEETRHELVFVNENIADYQQLINGLPGDDTRIFEVVVLESDRSGIDQVSTVLAERSDIDAIHIISHGADGSFALGADWLDNNDLLANSDSISTWGDSLSEDADILLYGCNIAVDADGQTLTGTLAELTGTDVAASDDLTGNAALKGDWELEYQRGEIETVIPFDATVQQSWNGLLATFTDHTITTTDADGAWSCYAVDVDGDSDMDVLSASYNDDKIAWYENDGSENFTVHTIATTADGAYSVYAVDVDGDSDMDVLSASNLDDKIAWYENDGNENFTAHTITTDADGAMSVYAVDVDGDSDMDVLSASRFDDKINWYENDGSENFTVHTIATTADGVYYAYAVDVDGDSDLDVLSASYNDDKIAWYENDGNENFTAHTIATDTDGARSVYAVDVDGDSDVDVLSASYIDGKIAWYENDGNENFIAQTITTDASGARSVYAVDVDGDSDVDVISASYNDDKIAWYENDTVTSDPPTIGLPGGAIDYLEGDGAVIIDAAATVSDPDSLDFDGGALTVSFTEGGTTDDWLAVRNQGTDTGEIGVSGSNVTYGGTIIGTLSGGMNGSALVITLNAAADATATQALLRNVTYENFAVDPDPSSRTVGFLLSDGDGGTGNAETETINLSPTYEILRPNAVGDATGIDTQSPVTGEHWDKLDETIADDAGTYISTSSTSYQQDLYNLTDHTGDGPINSVTVHYDVASQADTTICAIAYQNSDSHGVIKTVSVAGDGQIITEIDSIEFDLTFATTPTIVHISGSMYAIAYTGAADDGYLKTVEIDANGQITDTVIDTLEFVTDDGISPSLIHVSGDVFAIAYQGKGDDGFLKTVQIAADGQITDTWFELEFDTVLGDTPEILHVSGDIYAIAYQGLEDGFLKTVEIAADGQITDPVVDTLIFDGAMGNNPSITQISGNIYAIAYGDSNNAGQVKTVEIADDGQITDTLIDSFEFISSSSTFDQQIIPVSNNIFAIVIEGTSTGLLRTVEISDSGEITHAVLDSMTFDSGLGGTPRIVPVGAGIFAIAYEGVDSDGWLTTVSVASDGQIGDAVIDSYEFDIGNGTTPSITAVPQTPGTAYARPVLKTGGTVLTGTEVNTTSSTFTTQSFEWTINPDTGAAWTWAEIDALQAGLELRTDSAGYSAVATQVYVVVDYENPLANQAPALSLPGVAVDYNDGDGAVVIDATATVTDSDSLNFDTGTLTVDFTVAGSSNDRLAINDQGAGVGNISISGTDVTYDFGVGAVVIGSFVGGADGSTPLVVTFNLDSDATAVEALVQNITYENVSEAPDTTARTVHFVLTDGDNGTSAATQTINVSSVNDAPVNSIPGAQTTPEDTDLVFSSANGNAITISDTDATSAEVTLTATNGIISVSLDGSIGSETLVNTTTGGIQEQADIAVAADGSYVVAWASQNQDGDGYGVYAQRYDADGNAVGGEIPVNNTSTTGDQTNPSIAMDDAGNFVVTWQTTHVYTTETSVFAQRFDADGTGHGEFRVDGFSGANMQNPTVAMNATGAFVIAFEAEGGFDGNLAGIYAKWYDSDGVSQGSGRVNDFGTNDQTSPAVAMDGAGNFVVVWQSYGQDNATAGWGVYGQRYDADGNEIDGEFLINTDETVYDEFEPSVAMDSDGNFVVAWTGIEGNLTQAVFTQLFDNSGAQIGGNVRVNTENSLIQDAPSVAMQSNGDFTVVWNENYQEGAGNYGIYGQRYTSGGAADGGEFRINTTTTGDQVSPAVGVDQNGRIVVAWSGEGPDDTSGVFVQRMDSVPSLTFTAGDGTDDTTMTFTGTIDDINTALDGVTFTPTASFNGTATITITTDDQGNTGTGGALTDTDVVNITVGTANEAPTTTDLADVTVDEDAVDTVINLFSAFDDVEDEDSALTYSIESNTNAGLFNATTIDGVAGTLTLDYAADQNGTADITVRATDTGGEWVESSFTVTIDAVNDAPTASATAIDPTYTEGNIAVDLFSTVTLNTVESGQTIEQIVLTVSNVTDGSNETIT